MSEGGDDVRLERWRRRRSAGENAEALGREVESFGALVVVKNDVAVVTEGVDDCGRVEDVV